MKRSYYLFFLFCFLSSGYALAYEANAAPHTIPKSGDCRAFRQGVALTRGNPIASNNLEYLVLLRQGKRTAKMCNLPQKIDLTGGRLITTTYAADGRKLRTVAKEGNQYSDGTKYYNGNLVLDKNRELEYVLFDEGRLLANGDGSFRYEYHFKDHLGSTRVVFLAGRGMEQQRTSYYPFGSTINAMSWTNGLSDNRYGYTGKEKLTDFNLNWYDFVARAYNPNDGRFMSIDPMCEKYYWISPYAYCANNPLKYVDPTGETFYIAFQGDEARRLFEQNINSILNKQFTVTLTETSKGSGTFEVGLAQAKGGSVDNLSKGAKSFHEGLSGVINSKTVVSMQAVSGDKNVHTGKFETGQIDMADVNQFPEFDQTRTEQEGPTKQGKIMHEVREQFKKSSGEKSYDRSHANALNWEDLVNGNTRERTDGYTQTFWRTDRTKNGGFLYKTKLSTWGIDTKSPIIKVKRLDE